MTGPPPRLNRSFTGTSTTFLSSSSDKVEEKHFLKYEVEALTAKTFKLEGNPFLSCRLLVGPPFPTSLSPHTSFLETALEAPLEPGVDAFEGGEGGGKGVELEWEGKGEVEVNAMSTNLVVVILEKEEEQGEMKGFVRIPVEKMNFGVAEWYHIKMKKESGETVVGLMKLQFTDLAPMMTDALGAIRAKAQKSKKKAARKDKKGRTMMLSPSSTTLDDGSSSPNGDPLSPPRSPATPPYGTTRRKQPFGRTKTLFRTLSVRGQKRNDNISLDQVFQPPTAFSSSERPRSPTTTTPPPPSSTSDPPSSPPTSPTPFGSPPPTRAPPPLSPNASPPPSLPPSSSSSSSNAPPITVSNSHIPIRSLRRRSNPDCMPTASSSSSKSTPDRDLPPLPIKKVSTPDRDLPPLPSKSSSASDLFLRTQSLSDTQKNSPLRQESLSSEESNSLDLAEEKGKESSNDGSEEIKRKPEENKENNTENKESQPNQRTAPPKRIRHPGGVPLPPLPTAALQKKEDEEEVLKSPLPERGKSPPPSSPPPSILLSPTFRSRSPPKEMEKEKEKKKMEAPQRIFRVLSPTTIQESLPTPKRGRDKSPPQRDTSPKREKSRERSRSPPNTEAAPISKLLSKQKYASPYSPPSPSIDSPDNELPEAILEAFHSSSSTLSLSGLKMTAIPHSSSFPDPLPTSITELDVSFNLFKSFPLLPFSSLQTLDLSGNLISEIPPNTLPPLSGLSSLNLAGNRLTSLPPTVYCLTSLTYLNFSGNSLTALPSTLSICTNLEEIDISENEGIVWENEAKWAEGLKRLRVLNCNGCKMTEVPLGLCDIGGLLELDLNSNQLESLPNEIGQLSRLSKLSVMNNQLTDLPVSMGKLDHIIELHITMNPLKNAKLKEKMKMGTDHVVEWLELRMTALEAYEKREGRKNVNGREGRSGEGRKNGGEKGGRRKKEEEVREAKVERVSVVTDDESKAKAFEQRKTRLIHGERDKAAPPGGVGTGTPTGGFTTSTNRSPPISAFSTCYSPRGYGASPGLVSPSPQMAASPTFSPMSPMHSPLSPQLGGNHSPTLSGNQWQNQQPAFSASCPTSHPVYSQSNNNQKINLGLTGEWNEKRGGSQQYPTSEPHFSYQKTPASRAASGSWAMMGNNNAPVGGGSSLYSPMSNSLNSLPSSSTYMGGAPVSSTTSSPLGTARQKCDSAIKICKSLCIEVLGLCSALQLTLTSENNVAILMKIASCVGKLRDPVGELKSHLQSPPREFPVADLPANGRDEQVLKLVGALNRTLGDVRGNVDMGMKELGGMGVEDVQRIVGIARALKGVKEGLEVVV